MKIFRGPVTEPGRRYYDFDDVILVTYPGFRGAQIVIYNADVNTDIPLMKSIRVKRTAITDKDTVILEKRNLIEEIFIKGVLHV